MTTINQSDFNMVLTIDGYNKRLRIDDVNGHLNHALSEVEVLAEKNQAEKVIIKAKREDFSNLLEKGFLCEAVIDRYFLGSDMYFFCKYYQPERRNSTQWTAEDSIVEKVVQLQREVHIEQPPEHYLLRKITTDEVEQLAALYKKVFQIYPTPLHDPQYIKKTLQEGTIYYGYFYDSEIVSAASAEVNGFYKNAELTDCATLVEHRKHGLMKVLLQQLEADLKQQGIYCAYSIARALSFGMNAALHQLGYNYRGRLANNCYIFDKLEDMNVWVKNLSQPSIST